MCGCVCVCLCLWLRQKNRIFHFKLHASMFELLGMCVFVQRKLLFVCFWRTLHRDCELQTVNCELWADLNRTTLKVTMQIFLRLTRANTKHQNRTQGTLFDFPFLIFFLIFFPARTLSAWGGNGNQKYSMLVNRKTSKISRGKGEIPIPPKNPSFIAHWSSLFGFGLLLIVFGRVYVGP